MNMNNSGKSSTEDCVEGMRRTQNGVELPKRSERKKDYANLAPKPHDSKGRLIRI